MSDELLKRIELLSTERRELLEMLMKEESTEVQTNYVAPHTPVEEALATIWSQALGIKQVGIHDNFLALGGDSIQSIQVVAKAHQLGLQFSTSQLFEYPTIAELATVVDTIPVRQAQQEPIKGAIPLTPIQKWFFEQNFPEPHHWNQAVLLELQPGQDPALLEKACQKLLEHHDALRLRFEQKQGIWQQVNEGLGERVAFAQFNLSDVSQTEQKSAIEKIASELQSSLSLSQEPLMKVAFFHLGSHQTSRLLLILHHLIEDAFSLRVLVEDLQTAYQQLQRQEIINLPPKTTSFQQWSCLLMNYANSSELKQELNYWLTDSKQISSLPVDLTGGANTEASTRILSVSLTPEETRILLQEIPAKYHTQINEVLLTALAQTISQWTGMDNLLIDLEGHGREEVISGVDLSRTVGFFTSVFPVYLSIGKSQSAIDILMSMKEQIRRIPKRGIGYGLLRYCCEEQSEAGKLSTLPQAEIIFNYLGQFDRVFGESSTFRLASESPGATISPSASRSHLLQVMGKVMGGQLEISWGYSENIHLKSTVEQLAIDFMEGLRSLIALCQSTDTVNFTPSDFPEAELTQEELNQLLLNQ
ncbi:MAG: hypothetical protein KME52_31335 [Desmonostoc geniculatum HA4340-LM1]|jgi:non-ribosomal peptide synthase protein (TIGR01720 family)|nr:hypothetical protein [Desmonostoc geniculatum HA4340-LM1]